MDVEAVDLEQPSLFVHEADSQFTIAIPRGWGNGKAAEHEMNDGKREGNDDMT